MAEPSCAHQTLEIAKKKGLRMTPLRKQILNLILQSARPLSAYALVGLYKEKGSHVTATTIYRTLDFLEAFGFVHRVVTKNSYIGCSTPGHSLGGQFLICQTCQSVAEMHDEDVRRAVNACATGQHFSPSGQIVEVWGLCQACIDSSGGH
jgi:Fur family zinc uptake transcriptional regulator